MRKLLIFNIFLLFTVSYQEISAQSAQLLYNEKDLDYRELIENHLYHPAIDNSAYNQKSAGLLEYIDDTKIELIGKLHVQYPELTSELGRHTKLIINSPEISSLIKDLIQKESIEGLIPADQDIIQYASSLGLNKKESSSFGFYYGYEQFKKKNFQTALKAFETCTKSQKSEYNYAQYYSALAYLMLGKSQLSLDYLKNIRNEKSLDKYLPYYLAAAHYTNREYDTIIKYYANRIEETQLYNHNGLIEIVALSYYQKDELHSVAQILEKYQDKKDINHLLLLAYCYNRTGQFSKVIDLLENRPFSKSDNDDRLKFEKAFAKAQLQEIEEAIYLFNDLADSSIDSELLRYNIALLYGHSGNSLKAISQAKELLNGRYHDQTKKLISAHINNIEDTELLQKITHELSLDNQSKNHIIRKLFIKSLEALSRNDILVLENNVNLMKSIDPTNSKILELIAHQGIDAFKREDYRKAKEQLIRIENQVHKFENQALSIDVFYFLGYIHFKNKNPKSALGYFTKSFDQLSSSTLIDQHSKQMNEDLLLRIGDSYFLTNDLSNAEKSYAKIISQKGEQSDYALYKTAQISELNGKVYDHIILLEELLTDYPHSKFRFRAAYNCANSLFLIGQYERAEDHYSWIENNCEIINLKENSIIQLGLINVNAGNYSLAEKYYKRIIQSSNNNDLVIRAKNALKEIYSDYEVNTEAYVEITSQIESNKLEDEILYDLAYKKYLEGEYSISQDQFNKLISQYPQSDFIEKSSYYSIQSSIELKETKIVANEIISYLKNESFTFKKKDAQKQLFDFLYSDLKDYNTYLEYYALPWFYDDPDSLYHKAVAQINTDQINELIEDLPDFLLSNSDAQLKSEIISSVNKHLLDLRKWDKLLQLRENPATFQFINNDPKEIYIHSLALMNTNQYDNTIKYITDNYDILISDKAWLAKSVILLSDTYYLNGDKKMAVASLEGLLQSEIEIPASLRSQAQSRLNNLNL